MQRNAAFFLTLLCTLMCASACTSSPDPILPEDGGGIDAPASSDASECACDTTAQCDIMCACDPLCGPSCACDVTTACDGTCGCDADCETTCTCDISGSCDPDCSCDLDCGSPLCSDDCPTSNDGECDDGGPGSDFNVCALGTDCTDCGPREAACSCGVNECGDNGCGASCGDCEATERCEAGTCIDRCSCGTAECGDNGCGDSCGTCDTGETCIAGQCEASDCSCGTRRCGSNACGESCGTCDTDERCDLGRCVSTVAVGRSCSLCDDIFESTGQCFHSGSAVRARCGGTTAGDPRDIPWCRRGVESRSGYCTISCGGSTSCPSGYTCRATGLGIDGCLRD